MNDIAATDRRNWLRRAGSGILGFSAGSLLLADAHAIAPLSPAAPRRRQPPLALHPAAQELLRVHATRLVASPTPGTTLGPYWLANMPVRSDITLGQTGMPVRLFYQVLDVNTLLPIPGAAVDLWQANACGVYSGFASQGTQGQTWLRGVQPTDSNGICVFDTVFPGWYVGRTAHIHARVRPTLTAAPVLTTQFFFGELLGVPGLQINPVIYQFIPPYGTCGAPQTLNQNDGIYNPALSQIAILRPDGPLGLWAGLVILI